MTDVPSPFFRHNVDCCLADAPLFGRICLQITQRVRNSLLASLFSLTIGLASTRIYRTTASSSPRPSVSIPYRFQSIGYRWLRMRSATSIRHRSRGIMSLVSAQAMRSMRDWRRKKNEAIYTSTRMTTCTAVYRNGFLDTDKHWFGFPFRKVSGSLCFFSPWML